MKTVAYSSDVFNAPVQIFNFRMLSVADGMSSAERAGLCKFHVMGVRLPFSKDIDEDVSERTMGDADCTCAEQESVCGPFPPRSPFSAHEFSPITARCDVLLSRAGTWILLKSLDVDRRGHRVSSGDSDWTQVWDATRSLAAAEYQHIFLL